MKLFSIISIIAFLSGCTVRSNMNSNRSGIKNKKDYKYNVYKIDSINSYYLIYARKGDSLFKIVSKKDKNLLCKSIIQNHYYEFKLHSQTGEVKIGNVIIPVSLHVNCFGYDDSTSICLERDSITALYHGDNIKGLCFLANK